MRLTDGKKTVEISMHIWDGKNLSEDISNDFFEAGALEKDEEKEAYIVPDVDYCVSYAQDWEQSKWDFADDYDYYEERGEEKILDIDYVNE